MDKLSYALGLSMGHNFLGSGIKSLNVEDFAKGVEAVYKQEKPEISFDEAKKIINEFFSNLQDEIAETNKQAGKEFLAENAKRSGVVVLHPCAGQGHYQRRRRGIALQAGPASVAL